MQGDVMIAKWYCIYVYLGVLCFFACSKKTESAAPKENRVILAVVDTDSVSLNDFRTYSSTRKSGENSADTRQQQLTELVHQKLIEKYSYADKLNETDAVKLKMRTKREESFYEMVVRGNIYYPLVTDDEIKSYYEKLKSEIKLKHIFIGFNESRTGSLRFSSDRVGRRRISAKGIADSLYTALAKNPNLFSLFVSEYSEDLASKYMDGETEILRWGEADPHFQEIAFALKPDEISVPIETVDGYHIVKVIGRRRAENLRAFEDAREGIRDILADQIVITKREEAEKRKKVFSDSIFQAYHYQIHQKTIDMFLSRYQSIARSHQIRDAFTEDQRKSTLVSYDRGGVTVEDLVIVLEDNATKVKLDAKLMQEGLRNAAATRIFAQFAQEQNYKLPLTQEKYLKGYEINLMTDLAVKQNVDNKVTAGDGEIRSFYENNKNQYRNPGQVKLAEIASLDSNVIYQYASEIQMKASFDTLYQRASKIKGNHCQITGFLADDLGNELIRNSMTLKVGEVGIPLRKINGEMSLLKVVDRKLGEIIKLELIRGRVTSDYVASRKKIVYNEWMASLATRFKAQIFSDELKKAYDVTIR
jgi:hypothetical protein